MIALKFFETMTALVFRMWECMSNIDFFEVPGTVGEIVSVPYTSILIAFALLEILIFRFFRSQ